MTINGKFGGRFARVVAIGLIALTGSCHGWPLDPPPAQATLAVCPAAQTDNTSSLLGVLGGTVSLDGTSVFLPVNALLSATDIELTIPASQYMEIGVTANGGHFVFQLPVTVTIDYSRCSSDVQQQKLSVWHIDPQTHELLESMGGVDVKLTHTITFTTDHFSGFAIAY